jgi:hypothetical protein
MKQSARLDHAINVGCREGSFYKTRTLKIVAKLPVKTLLANRVTAALITVCASQISISWQTVNIITGETKKTVDIFLRALESITALWWVGWAVVAFSKASLALTLTGRIAFESSAAVAARGALTTLLNAAFTRRTSVVGRAALAATCATLAAISIAAPISRAARARESSAATAHGANGIYSNADCRICANTTQAIESSAAVAARANFVFWKTAQIISRTNGSSIAALAVTRAAHVNIGSVAALVITAREWATAAARGAIFTWFNADSRSCANTGNAIESIAAVAAHRAIFTIWNTAYANGRTRNDLANGVVRAALLSVLVIGVTFAAFDTILIAALQVASICSWFRAHRLTAAHGRAKLAGVPTCLETTVFVIKLKESSDRA